ncbi:tetratricopeptide repeat-containing sensor histidine kinase [Parapedobacter tibetensis]|uniref:tetratricopeptide repeat-containing sensor histidine kinase n=1 Tax=Parapedobacter tibetensis TaxID=2972951 RepID=UPI00214DA289|nr:tetratricopeptide repeat protein [Parapedobacter tibetensis]
MPFHYVIIYCFVSIVLLAFCPIAVAQLPTKPSNEQAATIDSFYHEGSQLLLSGDLDAAHQRFSEGLSVAKTQGDSLNIGRFYHGLGTVLQHQQAYEEALLHYHKSIAFIQEDQYPDEVGKTYGNLGALYAQQKDFQHARQYLERALATIKEENVRRLHIMANLAALYLDQGDLEQAESLTLEAITSAKTLNQAYIEATLYTNLSKLYTETNQWKRAIPAGERALHIKDSIKQGSLVAPRVNIGYAYENLGALDTAMKYYHDALGDASGTELLGVLQNLKRIAKKVGNLRESLRYYDRYDQVKDSIAELNRQAQVAELTEKYESKQKQGEIDHLQAESKLQGKLIARQRVLVGISLALLLLFAVLVYVWLKQNKTRQALEKSKMQQRFLLTQLNPHFIFNALQSVQSYIFKNKPETSMEYLNSFAKLIRSVLEHSDHDTISLEEEMEMIRNFLHLQQLNHQNDFTYEITPGEPPAELDGLHIPAMLVQPFVENAVIHGMRDVPEGKISVNFKQEEGLLKITICDNGKGIQLQKRQKANALHRSMGTEIIHKRIREFNKVNERKINVQITPFREHPEFPGTKVVLDIPVLTYKNT